MNFKRCEYCQEEPHVPHGHFSLPTRQGEVRSPPVYSIRAAFVVLETLKSPAPQVMCGVLTYEAGRQLTVLGVTAAGTLLREVGESNLPEAAEGTGFHLASLLKKWGERVDAIIRNPAPKPSTPPATLPPGYPFTRPV